MLPDDNNLLAEFSIENVAKALAGQELFLVAFKIDGEGFLHVNTVYKSRKYPNRPPQSKSITVQNRRGFISKEERESIRMKNLLLTEIDEAEANRVRARLDVETLFENLLRENPEADAKLKIEEMS